MYDELVKYMYASLSLPPSPLSLRVLPGEFECECIKCG